MAFQRYGTERPRGDIPRREIWTSAAGWNGACGRLGFRRVPS